MEGKKTIIESRLTPVESIIHGIKPPFPLESQELYEMIRPDDAASEILVGLQKSLELKKFLSSFVGQIVVEIGPGEQPTGYNIALLSGARAYVGVEPYYFVNNLRKFLEDAEYDTTEVSHQIPRTAIEADALSFLKRLPDRSVSIFASQLESVMTQDYRIAVEKEIERVLHPQGAFIQYDSKFNLNPHLFKSDLFNQNLASNLFLHYQLEKYQLKT